ncbi:MAG: SRPBCC domain-containing protein [Phycisphaerales bacterium JB043]
MMMHRLMTLVLVFLAAPAVAQDERDTIVQEYVISAPVSRVWDAFTTEEGIEGFMASHAQVDLRVGGAVMTHYGPDSVIGDPETIRHTILTMIPGRMYSGRVDFPFNDEVSEFQRLVMETWGVVEFEALSPDVTLVRLTSCNYGRGGTWDQVRAFFNQGNDFVMRKLREYLEAPDIVAQSEDVLRLLGTLAGGEWTSSQEMPDGSRFTTRSVVEHASDGRSLIATGWLGNGESEFHHSSEQIWLDPSTGLVRFVDVSQGGDVATGVITLKATNTLSWDWNATTGDGERHRYRVEQHFAGEHAYTQRIYVIEQDGDESLFVETVNRRAHAEDDPEDRVPEIET